MFTGNKDEDDFTVIQCKAVLSGAFSDVGGGKNPWPGALKFSGNR